ncbi:serine/threonine protein kinase [Coriobacterium glomerans PW2]|uniref:non-specific serine/threonine protein kinase n=1 Tax=Coriobacterium glomerans (strain ATCC 49209 / DSM 20642 / JCM 10262 / PW2) TaxID=700015 RepID=F2N975_CORGP|nr:serine/threonine-protein kinase [Coriobacterium glomerans]AEB07751.1 serine/threonine protein kinase [Coriobacterium glomerans PW2]
MPNLSQHTTGATVTGPAAASTRASSLLRRYRPIATRAAGGFGMVEICLDARLQRRVAIKRMPLAPPGSNEPMETIATALAEARTASLLPHPNIVTVFDFSYDETYAYLVMEYINGLSLEELLQGIEGNSLTFDETAYVADALTQALSYAHENGALHLDIKPANVLIDREGHVKLTDFGMATLTSAAGFGSARGGTVDYMSPEQLRGERVDERSDVFSLACVLYEALCSTSPFRAETTEESLKRMEQDIVAPHVLLPDISSYSEDALLRALRVNPEDRLGSVNEFGSLFLYGLGEVRPGGKSLSSIVVRLASDEEQESDGEDASSTKTQGAEQERRLDPAEGTLGSRLDKARDIVVGAIAAISVAVVFFRILQIMGAIQGVGGYLLCGIESAAIGAIAGLAPPIGAVLLATGFLMTILDHTAIFSVLPVAVVALALVGGWWYACGRVWTAASAVFVSLSALALICGDATLGAGLAIVVAAYFLPPIAAAGTCALGIAFSRLMLAVSFGGGALDAFAAARALSAPMLWISIAALSAAAALTSLVLESLWERARENRGTGLLAPACLVPGIMVVLLPALANPMEIASLGLLGFLLRICVATLSSILVWLCVRVLGYRKS